MKNLRYICAQPANDYYLWQVEVVINNFIKNGVAAENIDILLAITDNKISDNWEALKKHYSNVRFFFYEDLRVDKSYIPSIYFNLMKQHLQNRPELKDEVLFLHDSDIIFTKPVNFDSMIAGDVWYLSDTNSYINYDYIQQKGNDVYEAMCEIVGIDKLIPKLMNTNSGGAQYIVKNTTYDFWDKVEKDSINLYRWFCDNEHLHIKKNENDYPIQKWTAGMWGLLWNAWLFGNQTIVDSRLDFTWSTNLIEECEKYYILHNAGVTNDTNRLFFKGNYINKLPYNDKLDIDETKASYYYWNEIQEVAKKSILLNKFTGKKTAIGLFGIHYQKNLNHWMPEWIIDVNYKNVLDNNKEYLYRNNDITFYSSTYFTEKLSELINDFKFKKLHLNEMQNEKNEIIENRLIKRNKRFKETIKLILDDNTKYDYVILTRYDIWLKQNPLELNIDYSKVNVICGAKWGDDDTIIDDNFYFMPYSKLQEFYNAIDLIDEKICAHEYNKYISDIHRMIDDNFYSHDIPAYTLHRKLI